MFNRRRALIAAASKKGRLPSEYQEVEYLESSGTQYIDTGVNGNEETKVLIRFSSQENFCAIFGAQANQIGLTLNFGAQNNTRFGNVSMVGYNGCMDGQAHTIILDKNGFLDNGIVKWMPTLNSFNTANLYLFRANGAATTRQNKIYMCDLYDEGVIVKQFIPCYRKSDNEPGMYDLVNDVFYTNAGSGSFVVGGNVN